MNQPLVLGGSIFTITRSGANTTERCRACPFEITYRERPSVPQRNAKYAHNCKPQES